MNAGPNVRLQETPAGTADRAWAAAQHRYFHDPLFSAKVKGAVAFVASQATGGPLTSDEAELATRAAVMALHLADACIVLDGTLVVMGA